MSAIEITLGDLQPCPRCTGSVLLVARIPHEFHRADGVAVSGTRGVPLCPSCDRTDPAAQGLLACFAVDETVTDDSVPTVAALVEEWVERVAERNRRSDADIDLEVWGDYRRWRLDEV